MKMPGLFENNLRKVHCWKKALMSRGGCSHEIARNCTTLGKMMALKLELHFMMQVGIYCTGNLEEYGAVV